MTNKEYVLGIDIGGTNFRLGLVDKSGVLYKFVIKSSSILITEGCSVNNLVKCIKEYLNEYLDGKLVGVGIGFPSTISKNKKIVYSTPNLKGFDNINIVDPIENAFNVPVFLNNDVNNLLQYDMVQKRLIDYSIVLGFYIGTGLGNAVYINNGFLDGKNGVAAELGHIPMIGKNDLCSCGNIGCIEMYASGKRLKEIKETYFKDTYISDVFKKHKDDPIIKEFIEAVSIPIATEINIFDPDCVVIGGGVLQMPEFPMKELEQNIFKHARKPYPAEGLEIIYSDQDQRAGVLGASYYVFENLKKDNLLLDR